jgi:plastin-3
MSQYSSQIRANISTDELTEAQLADLIHALEIEQVYADEHSAGQIKIDRLAKLQQEGNFKHTSTTEMRHWVNNEFNNPKVITPIMAAKIYIEDKRRVEATCPGFKRGVGRISSVKYTTMHKEEADYDAKHTVSKEEIRAYSSWINRMLKTNSLASKYLPINPKVETGVEPDLFDKVHNGVILCLMLQQITPDNVDARSINHKFVHPVQKHENLRLAINTAASLGCSTININSDNIVEKNQTITLGLVWQIIAKGLFVNINLANTPNIAALLKEGETLDDLQRLDVETILLRWVNYQLEHNENYTGQPINNFTNDIKDSVAYQYLLEQIQPEGTGLQANPSQNDLLQRAGETLNMADKLDCREFVDEHDIVTGHPRLNLAFVANLFNNHPALGEVEQAVITETREEKTYRNWMNSLGIMPREIMYLYTDLRDGLALLRLEDHIREGHVNWKRVSGTPEKPFKQTTQHLTMTENCNYAIELAPPLGVKIIAINGSNIYEGNKMLTLAVVWQLMRAYTLGLLASLSDDGTILNDSDVLKWLNQATGANARSLQDPKLRDGVVLQKALRKVDPNVDMLDINPASGTEDMIANARYVINTARKMGAVVYTLPEDIAEGNKKMILCFVVTLMVLERILQQA